MLSFAVNICYISMYKGDVCVGGIIVGVGEYCVCIFATGK